jgi:hypothetical protein
VASVILAQVFFGSKKETVCVENILTVIVFLKRAVSIITRLEQLKRQRVSNSL